MSSDLALESDVLVDLLSDPIELGAALKRTRKAAGMTQEDAGQELGVARTTITAIERGQRHVRIQELRDLSVIYRCDISQFFTVEEVPAEVILSARKRVLKRIFTHPPDAKMQITLEAAALSPKELERMAATLLHMLIEREEREECQ